jgi:hypothetical protein
LELPSLSRCDAAAIPPGSDVALGRKTYLIAGFDADDERAAAIYKN